MPNYPTFHTTRTNTKPFALNLGKVLGGGKKKTVRKKDTLQQLLCKLQVSILVLSAPSLNLVIQAF